MKKFLAVLLSALALSSSAFGFEGFIGITNGYFYDKATGEPFVPHGIAYQTWNRPLGVWQSFEQIDYDLDEMVKMGANSVRIDMVWQHIEGDLATTVAEGDNNFDWGRYDYFVDACERRGLRIFALIGYQWPPNWFPDEWYTQHPPETDAEGLYHDTRWQSDIINYEHPEARAQYAEWLAAVAGRYKDSKAIAGWIVGNESGYLGLWSGLLDGYDDQCQAAFRAWCERKYGTIAACNAAWGTSYGDLSDIFLINQYSAYGSAGAQWADMVQWREDSIASFTAVGAVGAKSANTNHLISYSTVGMQWGEEDWRYHAEDRGKITKVCLASNAPIDFFSVNNYPWAILGHESQQGHWGITYTKKVAKVPVLYSETGFTSSESMYPGMNEFRQGPLVRNALWESLQAGAIGTHVFSWMDRPWITDREKGFGIVYADRRLKPAFWDTREVFTVMDQVDIHTMLMGSEDPSPDIAFLWTDANDSQYNRYECEMQQIAGPLERLGYEPGFLNLEELAAGAYTNFKAIILPRNMRVEDEVPGSGKTVLDFLRENVIAAGVHIVASADIPGLQNFNGWERASCVQEVDALFGIDVSDAGGYEAPARTRSYVGSYWHPIDVTFTTNVPAGAPVSGGYSYSPQVWKYSDEVKLTDGEMWAHMDSNRNKGYEDSDTELTRWDGSWGQVHVQSGLAWAFDGDNMAQLRGNAGMWRDFPAVPGGRYTHSAYFRSNSDDPLRNGKEAYVAIEWYDANMISLGTNESALLTAGTGDEWVRYEVDCTAPEGTWTGRRIIGIRGEGDGSLFVDNRAVSPALVVKNHGTAKAAIFLYAVGDTSTDGDRDGEMDTLPWKWRYDVFDSIMQDFGVESRYRLLGANACYALADFRTLADGSTLWQIKNYLYDRFDVADWDYLGGGDPQTFTLESDMLRGKTIEALYGGRIIAENSSGTIRITLPPDGMEMLLVRGDGDGSGDQQSLSSNGQMFGQNNARTFCADDGPQSFPLTLEKTIPVGTPVVIAGSRAYYTSGVRGFCCRDIMTDTLMWTFNHGGAGNIKADSIAVVGSTVFVTTDGYSVEPGAIFAVDADNGALKWTRQVSTTRTASAPVIDDGVVYFSGMSDYLYACDVESGELLWQSSAVVGASFGAGLSLADGIVVVPNGTKLSAVDADSGAVLWTANSVRSLFANGEVSVANGRIYVPRNESLGFRVYDLHTGTQCWARTDFSMDTGSRCMAVADGRLFAMGTPTSGVPARALYCYDATQPGEPLWILALTNMYATASPAVANGVVYLWANNSHMAVDAENGTILWSQYVGSNSSHMPYIKNNWVFFGGSCYSDGTPWPVETASTNQIVRILDAPAAVHPMGDKCYSVTVRYDCRNMMNLTLNVAFMEVGDNGDGTTNEVYQQLVTNVVTWGEESFWMWIPDADPTDPDYISTPDGGLYQFTAWLEDTNGARVAEARPQPVQLEWGVRPTSALPTALEKGDQVQVDFEWEDLYEYLPWENTPQSRSEAFKDRVAIFRSSKTEAQFPGHFDRVNEVADWLESMGYKSGNPLNVSFSDLQRDGETVAEIGAGLEDWSREAGCANWTVEESGTETEEWGFGAEYWTYHRAGISSSNSLYSLRIVADTSEMVDGISVFGKSYGFPQYRLGVYTDDNGKPSEQLIVESVFSPTNRSNAWMTVDLPDFELVEGNVYHFVVRPDGPVSTTNCIDLYSVYYRIDGRMVVQGIDFGSYKYWYYSNGEPVFRITYTNGATFAQPYYMANGWCISGTNHTLRQMFTPEHDTTISSAKFLMRKFTGTSGYLLRIRRMADDVMLGESLLLPEDMPESRDWFAFPFDPPISLQQGEEYALEFPVIGGGIYPHFAKAASPAESWGGSNSCVCLGFSSHLGLNWTRQSDADLIFLLEGTTPGSCLCASRIGNNDNILVADAPPFTNGAASVNIRYNEQGPYFNDAELYVRYVDRDNFVKVGIRNFYGFWRVQFLVRADRTLRNQGLLYSFSKNERPRTNEWHNLRVVVTGSHYEVFFDDEAIGSFDDSTFASGRIGIGSSATQLGIEEPETGGYFFLDDDEYSFWMPEGQPQTNGYPLNLNWGYLDRFYPTLILPGTYVMSDTEVSNVWMWITNGLRCLIATDGGVARKDETGADDVGRIEGLFGVAGYVDETPGLNSLQVNDTSHYVTHECGEGDVLAASGNATVWPLVTEGKALATVGSGSNSAPALIVNTLTNNPMSPVKVTCFNFPIDTEGQLTGTFSNIAKRAFEWARGQAHKVRLELKYPSPLGDPSLDLALLTVDGWLLTGSGTNSLIVDIPEQGIMTGDNLYWVLYVYPWDAADPWLGHAGVYSSANDASNGVVSIAGKGLQILGATDGAFAGRAWDLWAAYNTRGETLTMTYGIMDAGTQLEEESFADGDSIGWTVTPHANISWTVTNEALRAKVMGGGGYAYITRDGLDVSDKNITVEYDVLFEDGATDGGFIYRGRVLYVNPTVCGWEDDNPSYFDGGLLTTGKTHRVTLSIRDGDDLMSDLHIDGYAVFLSEPIEVTNWTSTTVGFLSPYSTGHVQWDNVRIVDEEYSFAPIEVAGEFVPTNANQATFWPWVPDYDPDWWEYEGASLGGKNQWYLYLKGAGISARQDVGVYFAPRLRTEAQDFPTNITAGQTANVPIEWEHLDGNLPAKLVVSLHDALTGSRAGQAEFDIVTGSGMDSFPVTVLPTVLAGEDAVWSAYIHPASAVKPWDERIGFDDTYRSDPRENPVEPEIKVVAGNTNGGAYVAYSDLFIPAGADWYQWPAYVASFDTKYAGVPTPEGDYSLRSSLNNASYAGWGVFYPLREIDLNEFDCLKFWVRSAAPLKVEVQAPSGTTHTVVLNDSHWDKTQYDTWQEVTIPRSEFGIESNGLSKVYSPFAVTLSKPYNTGLHPVDANTIFAIGTHSDWTYGAIRKSTNGGMTWTPQVLPSEAFLTDIDMVDANTGWTVGYISGVRKVFKTTDGGATWVQQTLPEVSSGNMQGICALNAQTAWTCGSGGRIYKTVDGGTSWVRMTVPTSASFYKIMFVDQNNGWAVGSGRTVVRTTDGGATWSVVTVATGGTSSSSLTDLHFFDAMNGWVCGDSGILARTSDGGLSWTGIPYGAVANLKVMSWVDSQTGHIGSNQGYVYSTTNGGATWSSAMSTGNSVMAIEFLDADTGFLVNQYGFFKKSAGYDAQGRMTWTEVSPQSGLFLIDHVRWTVDP